MISKTLVPEFETVDADSGCVQMLRLGFDRQQICSWGIEAGNWYGFFSQHRIGGTNVELEDKDITVAPDCIKAAFWFAIPNGKFLVKVEDRIDGGAVVRTASLIALEPSLIGDFAIRTAVPARDFDGVGTEVRRSAFDGRNVYHQVSDRLVRLTGAKRRLDIRLENVSAGSAFERVNYWRAEPPGTWIVHNRLIVAPGRQEVTILRARNALFDSRKHVWLRPPVVWRPLWRLNERMLGRLPTFQTAGAVEMQKNQTLVLSASLRFRHA